MEKLRRSQREQLSATFNAYLINNFTERMNSGLEGIVCLPSGICSPARGYGPILGTEDMAEDSAFSQLLSELDGIANSPMTGSQRDARAKPLIEASGMTIEQLASSLGRLDLEWNRRKAEEYDVSAQTWLHAVRAVGLPAAGTLSDFLYRLHQAEVAVRMLRSGYSPSESDAGPLRWRYDEPDAPADSP